MCGIFGAVYSDRPVEISAALDSIAHRGPDATGTWREGDVTFGHTRLAVIDLTPAAAQPMVSSDRLAVIAFNGEIYNHAELREELCAQGGVFRSRSDTEVIIEGYRQWGDGVVERLDGMFAFGIWDSSRQRLLLARDRAGKKPMFYTELGGGLRFASEVKSLIASGVESEVDRNALPGLLSFGYTPAPQTMYRQIFQLPPASLLTFERNRRPIVRRYWRAPFFQPCVQTTADDATVRIRELVQRAVRRRLQADVPLGAFLSGGIDSSIIVGVMARELGRPVKTFSIGFSGDSRYDETHYARIAARAFRTDHVEFTLQPSSFDLVKRLVALHDGPFGDSSAIPTSVVSMLTRQHVTVALTGDGGDELFCGYIRFLAAEAAERIPRPMRAIAARLSRVVALRGAERSLPTRVLRFTDAAALPLADRLARWSSLFAFELHDLLRPELASTVSIDGPLNWMRSIVDAGRGASTMARILDHNFETYLPYDLLVKADRASMAHGLETRSPFLDTALIEFAARLPGRLLRRGTTTKWILKRAFSDMLPSEILRRGKMGFGIPLGTWFRNDLREYLQDHLGSTSALLYEYLNPSYVRVLMDSHFHEKADHGHRLWLLLTLEVWLRSLREQTTHV